MKTSKKIIAKANRHRRIRAKISGSSERPRLVVFRSLKHNFAQLVDDATKVTLASASDLKIKKGTKSEKAKLVGEELAKKAKEKKIEACVFDRNGYKYHGRVKALADGAREGGLKF